MMKQKLVALVVLLVIVGPALGQTYTYSKASDFSSGLVPSNLKKEVEDSSITSATLLSIQVDGDVVKLVFSGALSSGDKTTLDGDVSSPAGGLIAAHSTAPLDDGPGWSYSKQVSEITTDSGSWAEIKSRNVQMAPGFYKITLAYLGAADSTAQQIVMRVTCDDVLQFNFQDTQSGGIANFAPRSFTFLFNETESGWKAWDVDWRRAGDAGDVKIKAMLLLIERMP